MQILEKAVEEGNHGDGLELINLVNENKALDNRLGNDQRIKGMNDQSYEFQQAKFQK